MSFNKVENGWKNLFVFRVAVLLNNLSALKNPNRTLHSTLQHNNILNKKLKYLGYVLNEQTI